MNDAGAQYDYPARVRFEIAENELGSYRRAADFLNLNEVDVVSLQHEYGIFGGKAGSHVLALLRDLRMPVVTTLHTILAEPNAQQRAAMNELLRLSERVVVMSEYGATLLGSVHGVARDKIDFIPHGIPRLPPTRRSKDRLGLEGNSVIMTLGLLSPDKGIENVIDALPAIVRERADTVYVILGATHPHVKQRDGETYRLMLESRALKLGVQASIVFHDRFVSESELAEFLAAADIYVTPYLKQEQITSGTLAYALGSGKAVVSTPYFYARELLADGRGVLVPWRDPAAIAHAITDLLGDDARRAAMCARGADYGRDMAWPTVAARYLASFDRARETHGDRRRSAFRARTLATRPVNLPEPSFAHLRAMTDDTGLLQHAAFTVPRYEDGYCLDDNARALLATALVEDAGSDQLEIVRALGTRYLAFVRHAYNARTGRFRNFMSYDRRFTEDRGSEDSHGRALWALGTVVGRSGDPGWRSLAGELFHAALPALETFGSPRAWSYALLGIDEYLRAFQGESNVERLRTQLARRLHDLYLQTATRDWPWFEDRLTYCNARLPHALIVSGAHGGDEAMIGIGLRSLAWLVDQQQSSDGGFQPVGSNGYYVRGDSKAVFDQQPVEASTMISACLEARRATGDGKWAVHARRAFDWFLGENALRQVVCDAATGGCRDGLHPDRVNENQGAESTLAYLLALLEMRAPSPREIPS